MVTNKAISAAQLRRLFVSGVRGGWPDDRGDEPRGWDRWRLLLHGEVAGDTLEGKEALAHLLRGLESAATISSRKRK